MSDALIHLRVPAELKARWVRESRAAGMRLTDWVLSRVERQGDEEMKFVKFAGGAFLHGKDVAIYESAGVFKAAVETTGGKTLMRKNIGDAEDLETFIEKISNGGAIQYQDAQRTANALKAVGFELRQ